MTLNNVVNNLFNQESLLVLLRAPAPLGPLAVSAVLVASFKSQS